MVTFSFKITNTSDKAQLRITGMVDTLVGDLAGRGDCKLGAVLSVGESYSCEGTGVVREGLEGLHRNTVTVGADRVRSEDPPAVEGDAGVVLSVPKANVAEAVAPLPKADVYGDDNAWALALPRILGAGEPIPIKGIFGFLVAGLLMIALGSLRKRAAA